MYQTPVLNAADLYPDIGDERIKTAVGEYCGYFGGSEESVRIFSAPGRVEICGNHTDHNNGKVLAAAVNSDIIAIAEPIDVAKAVIKIENEPEMEIWFENLSPSAEDDGIISEALGGIKPSALVRGILKGFCDRGFKIGGFKAYITSDIASISLAGTAAFEMLICTVISCLFNGGKAEPARMSAIAERAELKYHGGIICGPACKLACATGGFIAIDFKDAESPIIEKVAVDFDKFGHSLCMVDTGQMHADLTPEYSSIPAEMREIASFFDVTRLRRVAKQDIILNMDTLREEFGDRAVLRSLHFFDENDRVDKLAHALRTKEFEHFLDYVKTAGNSSYKYLQNVYTSYDSKHESVSLGLYFCESVLGGKGACRIHSEGFTGAIQAFVPKEMAKSFKVNIERIFGANSCHILSVRNYGGVEVIVVS